ncbi:unnamed protein product [Dibothriocephalus latus]|uniref:RING-type domain-containing protein n=1 Tax=Dibothriocephalus latus TaxID=60516 RepID=A0A3P7LM44_DIBLA|nr:unnamed protein product [Dibothriocephalus latus]
MDAYACVYFENVPSIPYLSDFGASCSGFVVDLGLSWDLTALTQEKCAVCWDVLSPGRQLRCGHVFHDACLRSWIGHMPTCPTCRANIPELGPSRGDVIQERELYATGSSNVASPAGHIPSPLSPTSEQQRRLQAAQPTTTADSSSIRNVSENGVSLALPNADATFASRSHQLGSGLSGVVAQLADELSTAFAALNNRSGVDSSTMQHVSTTVIVNNLVDARRDILPSHSLGNSDLPVKFLGELEAELMTYLEPSESTADGVATNELLSLPKQSSEIAGPSVADPSQPSSLLEDPDITEVAPSLPSSPLESCEDSSEEESSPKKIVRQAIRVLLLRAGQAAEAAHRLRSVNRHRHRGKTPVCSASSAFYGELPAGECNILSPPVLEEPLKPCEETPAIVRPFIIFDAFQNRYWDIEVNMQLD